MSRDVWLFSSSNAIEFLRRSIDSSHGGPRLTTSAWAKRCGFKSRAHLSEILAGKRPLTDTSLKWLLRGLKLTGTARKFFLLLVALDYPALVEEQHARSTILRKVEVIRRRQAASALPPQLADIITPKESGLILAALASPDKGTSYLDILRRTGLPRTTCRDTLRLLEEQKVIRRDSNTKLYFPATEHLDVRGLGASAAFTEAMTAAFSRAQNRCLSHAQSPHHLFFNSVFSIPQAALGQLKQELRELLVNFVDQHMLQEGDACIELTIACGPE